jgi:hypothetical protein
MIRDYRDRLIEDLVDRELRLHHQWRLERASLLDHIERLSRELEMLNPQCPTYRKRRASQTPQAIHHRQLESVS